MSSFGELIKTDIPVLIHFFTPSIENFKGMHAVVYGVAEKMGEQLRVINIDVEKNRELSDALRVKLTPTLMLYKKGVMIWRQTGFIEESLLINVVKTL